MHALPRTLAALTLVGTAAVTLGACSKVSEKVSEKATEKILEQGAGKDSKVDISNGGKDVTIKSEDGEFSTGSHVKLPDSFPAAVPTPEGAKLATAIASGGDFTLGYAVASWTDAIAAYRSQLTGAGFTETASYELGDGATYSFSGPGYEVSVTATKDSITDEGKDSLAVIVTPAASDATAGE